VEVVENIYLDYAAIILVVVGFCIGYGIFITPKKLDEILDKKSNKCADSCKEAYVTKEEMQIERKELLLEVERRFLEKVAFQEFTKRFDDKFEVMSKTLDKVVENQEHIKDYIIQKKGL
jgi:hypothetical protein